MKYSFYEDKTTYLLEIDHKQQSYDLVSTRPCWVIQGGSERDMNVEGMKRFEEMCRTYLNGNDRTRRIILSFLNEEEKRTFLEGCGLYHLFTDERYYKMVRQSVGRQIYDDFHKEQAEE